MTDSDEYLKKRQRFQQFLTLYGRKPVFEALQNDAVKLHRLHLADSNQPGGIIAQIEALARRKNVDIVVHDRRQLSRISKNGKQDQGVAADVELLAYRPVSDLPDRYRLLAVDGVTNPANLGMIIRSVAGSGITGLLVARRGQARLDAKVIKASAGALFRAPIFHCDDSVATLTALKAKGAYILTLDAGGTRSLYEPLPDATKQIYVLGNETSGISSSVSKLADECVSIPLQNGVESLNVAVAASLVAFRIAAGD